MSKSVAKEGTNEDNRKSPYDSERSQTLLKNPRFYVVILFTVILLALLAMTPVPDNWSDVIAQNIQSYDPQCEYRGWVAGAESGENPSNAVAGYSYSHTVTENKIYFNIVDAGHAATYWVGVKAGSLNGSTSGVGHDSKIYFSSIQERCSGTEALVKKLWLRLKEELLNL